MPPYPQAPAVDDYRAVKAYARDQQEWAVKAAAAYSAERTLRANTRECLDRLRALKLIN